MKKDRLLREIHELSPTLLEYASLAMHVYNPSSKEYLPDGWKIINKAEKGSYKGVCYIGPRTVRTPNNDIGYQIVYAHKGTDIKDIRDLWADLQILFNFLPYQFEYARNFVRETQKLINVYDTKDTYYITFQTGHSLGAILAQLCSVETEFGSTTFENPGAYPCFVKYFDDNKYDERRRWKDLLYLRDNSFVYQADINVINNLNYQVSSYDCIMGLKYNYSIDIMGKKFEPIPSIFAWTWIDDYYLAYSFEQHRMINIYNAIKEDPHHYYNKPYKNSIPIDVLKNINSTEIGVGIRQAHIQYLNYNYRSDYWHGYLKFLWEHNTEIRVKYKNDYSLFESTYKEIIKRARMFEKGMRTECNTEITSNSELAFNSQITLISKMGLFGKRIQKSKNEEIENDFVIVDKEENKLAVKENKRPCSIM